jgi:Flp pilus assembly protein TadG
LRFANFFRDRKGSVTPLLALSIIPLVGSVGAAVDYSRANSARTAMQGALDATALILARQGSSAPSSQNAGSYFSANFARPEVQNVQVEGAASPVAGGTSVNLTATGSLATSFLTLLGIPTLNLSVNSAASAISDGLGCVLSLDRTAGGAIAAQGSTSVNLNGCSLYDNSDSATALTVGGSASLSALSVGVVGDLSGGAGITTTLGIKTHAWTVDDPYANDSFPNFFACTEHNFTAKSAVTINPGVYCGGMKLNAGANVTLNPGIYYLDGGSLTVNGGATLAGNGVTLVFTKKNGSDYATANINGNATVNLTPPKSGSTAGIVVFGDRGIPLGTTFKFNGGATQYLGGAVYVPTGAISYAGGAGTSTTCTQIIGNTISFVGNSSLAINCSSYATKPFSPLVVKLVS